MIGFGLPGNLLLVFTGVYCEQVDSRVEPHFRETTVS